MSLVRPVCATCGAKTERLAVVMDPFTDSCYGVCAECMAALHSMRGQEILKSLTLAASNTGTEPK